MAEIAPTGPMGLDELWLEDEVVRFDNAPDHLDITVQDRDLLLIRLGSGGTACPVMWAFVDASISPAVVSEPFGTCFDGYDIVRTERGIEVAQPSTAPGESGDVTYWFEAGEVHDELGPPRSLGLRQVAEWEGRHPKLLVNDPGWEAWFLKRVGPVALLELRGLFEQASLFSWDGDWLVAEGCKADACDELRGVLMLHKDGDRVSAAVQRRNGDMQQPMLLMGSEDNDVIQAFIRMHEAQDE